VAAKCAQWHYVSKMTTLEDIIASTLVVHKLLLPRNGHLFWKKKIKEEEEEEEEEEEV
jgi:hypothetical protein